VPTGAARHREPRITITGATGNAAGVVLTEGRNAGSAGSNEASSTVVNAGGRQHSADLTVANTFDPNSTASNQDQALALTARGDRQVGGQAVLREATLGAHIRAQPWTDMSGFSWRTDARFREYRNTGPGAGVNGNRAQLFDAQAATYTRERYLAGADGWNPR
jgi:pectin methylesterase-like acyl-CoA thioesterase